MTTRKNQIVDLTLLHDFTGDDQEVLMELIKVFLKQTPEIIENIQKSLEENDWYSVSRQVHKLKPSLGTMGMEAEKQLATEIEKDCESGDVSIAKKKIDTLVKRSFLAMNELKSYSAV